MISDEKKYWAEELLRQEGRRLGRLPKKDDFDEPTRSRIKAYLGPWPRALEAAGLKAVKNGSQVNKKKRHRRMSLSGNDEAQITTNGGKNEDED